jgi:hypothetical protein
MTDDETEVALTQATPEQSTAWSEDDDDDDELVSTDQRTWLMPSVCAALAALAVVMVSAVWFITTHSARGSAVSVARGAPSSSAVVVPTVPPVDPSSVPNAVSQDKDSRFLALMATQHLAPHFMDGITEVAQWECGQIAQGEETKAGAIHRIVSGGGDPITWEQAEFFVNTSVDIYCPQYRSQE